MKRSLIFVVLAVAVWCQAQIPQKGIVVDLPKMFQEVDEAIAESPKFIRQHEERIEKEKQALDTVKTDNGRLLLQMQLYHLYVGFNGDSTLSYAIRTAETARRLELTDIEADYHARAAYLCTFLGSQTEALTLLKQIDKRLLSSDGIGYYYRAYLSAYESLADNCKTAELRKTFRRQHLRYRDSLLRAVPENSELYYFYYEDKLIKEGKVKQALKMNDERLNQAGPGAHEDAIIAYSRYRIYEKNGNKELAIYWLCRSALADIRNAVMDQMSLITLAKVLDKEGDYERASRYISFTWESNRRYSPHMRSWQIAPLLSAIEDNYQSRIDEKNRQLTMYTIAFLVLVIALLARNMFRRKKKDSEQEGE